MVETVTCSQGHKFPVNPKKHRNRTYVMCPECREKVKIRKRMFPFSRTWGKQRDQQRQLRREMKERGRKPEPLPTFTVPRLRSQMAGIFALSRLIQRQEEERATEGEKSEKNSSSHSP